jgi:DNA-binding NarL/FixJ family response regulator
VTKVERVLVGLQASDPLTAAGLQRCLDSCPDVALLPPDQSSAATVLVLVADGISADVLIRLRRSAVQGTPVVLVVNTITENELLTVVEFRVVAVLPRSGATAERVIECVLAAANGSGILPPMLIGSLLRHVERLQREVLNPKGINTAGLTDREVEVLRMMADGFETVEIAGRLCYSERTVKKVLYGVINRLELRNRSHAIAYAMRTGMI